MTDFHPHPAPAKHSGPLRPRMANERGEYVAVNFDRRKYQCHGFIEDYVDSPLIPLDPVERRQVRFWTIVCVLFCALFWALFCSAVIAAAVYIGAIK
jgi:hypothetical protein